MRKELILLVAGLAAVAALPVQETAASALQSDLLSIILGANPEENDLAAEHNMDLAAHTKTEVQPQDPAQDQQQTQPNDAPQEQPPQQNSETKSAEESSLSNVSGEEVAEDQKLEAPEARPEPQPILLNPQDFSYTAEEPDEAANIDPQLEVLSVEPDNSYVVLEMNKEAPSLEDMGGTFINNAQNVPQPLVQSDLEEPLREAVLHDLVQGPLSLELMDSSPLEPKESQSQKDPVQYNLKEPLISEEPLSSDPQMDSFLLNKEPLVSDYEQLPLTIKEGPENQYDYESTVGADQSDLGAMSSEPEDVAAEDSHHGAQDVTPVNLFSWFIHDLLNKEQTDYDEHPHTSGYHDEAMVAEEPEVQYESQVPEDSDQEDDVDDAVTPDGSLLGGVDDMVVVGKPVPVIVGLREGDTDGVSLADFFIPTYDASTYGSAPREYFSNGTPDDESQDLVSSDEGTYSPDDGLVHVEPVLKIGMVDEEQDQPGTMTFGGIMFPKSDPTEDGRTVAPWSTENDESDQMEYPEGDATLTILESQPSYIPDKVIDKSYPILLEIQDKETDDLPQPWSNPKPLVMDFTPDVDTEDNESLSTEDNDNTEMDIIVIKDSGETSDGFPTSPMISNPAITQVQSIPFTQYPEDERQTPYWMPQRIPDQQSPAVYFSVIDEPPRRKLPTFSEHLNENLSFLPPVSHRRLQAPVMRDPFTFMNEVTDDDMPPQFLASPSTSSQFRFMGPNPSSSPRNDQNSFETPRLYFRDLLQRLNPSNVQSPPLYNSQPYNFFPRYTSPPVPYSLPSDYSEETDYSPVQDYHPDRLQRLSFYERNNMPSGLFREDTMSDMYSHQPQRYFSDYTADLPFMPTNSFTSPRPRFPFLQRLQYEGSAPSYNRPYYPQNSIYSTGPYHPTPIYPIYAPEYYGM